jgi:hypothetical protein
MLFQDLDNNSSVRGWVKIDADASNWVATANQHLEGAVL